MLYFFSREPEFGWKIPKQYGNQPKSQKILMAQHLPLNSKMMQKVLSFHENSRNFTWIYEKFTWFHEFFFEISELELTIGDKKGQVELPPLRNPDILIGENDLTSLSYLHEVRIYWKFADSLLTVYWHFSNFSLQCCIILPSDFWTIKQFTHIVASFSWLSIRTKNFQFTATKPFPCTEAKIWGNWTHTFTQCQKRLSLKWKGMHTRGAHFMKKSNRIQWYIFWAIFCKDF